MKKILAIMMAMVMVLALTVAVAADWTKTYTPDPGFTTVIKTTEGDGAEFLAELEAIGDDAVVTFTIEIESHSYYQICMRDASWAEWPNTDYGNYNLFDIDADGSTYSVTYGELKAICEADGFSMASMMFVSNCGSDDPTPTVTITVTGKASSDESDADADADDDSDNGNDGEDNTPPANTGIALAVVPAVVAMAAVAVSKKH